MGDAIDQFRGLETVMTKTGHSFIERMRRLLGRGSPPQDTAPADAPSFPDHGIPASQEPMDEVEEASMESFPASDPPASRRQQEELK